MQSALRGLAFCGIGLLALAAACGHSVTDTGYLGTWERELKPGYFSRVAIWEEDGKTFFCWSTRGTNKGERVRCAPGGVSETIVRREVIYEHRFTVRPGENPNELLVDVEGVPRGEGTTPISWTDRLVVQPGGMELLSYKLSLNGQVFDKPRKPTRLTKVADVPI